ncbi:hypothetical protein [Sporosalibacterium faouarense]|uniref:hypothetical protein n=1 Tax=Sporosalibacterium faouarense TaxID=516123 RepID=UPI00141CD9ED|nr:hypothetical protein [Sporosalibacterium faouarense]MTI48726.1 hypothetical protein [Bacillota bacterium]
MGKLVAYIIVISFIVVTFLAAYNLYQNNYAVQDINYALSLSAKALANNVNNTRSNFNNTSKGYKKNMYEESIEVDKERLLQEFYETLYTNYYNEDLYRQIKKNILIKMIVYSDKCYVAKKNDKWSPPYFFTKESGGKLIYFNSNNDLAYYYNSSNNRIYTNISNLGITEKEKQQIVIDKINSIVAQNTYGDNREMGLKIGMYNPFNIDGKYMESYSRFNVLDGLTFFIVHASDRNIFLDNKEFRYNNYTVIGYTMIHE